MIDHLEFIPQSHFYVSMLIQTAKNVMQGHVKEPHILVYYTIAAPGNVVTDRWNFGCEGKDILEMTPYPSDPC